MNSQEKLQQFAAAYEEERINYDDTELYTLFCSLVYEFDLTEAEEEYFMTKWGL